MSKKTTAYRHHTLDVYGLALYLADTPKQWRQLRKVLPFLDDAAPTSAGFTQFAVWESNAGHNEPVAVVYINRKKNPTTSDLVDTIAHEAAHVAQNLLHYIGHTSPARNDEPTAYLVGWVTRWVWDQLEDAAA